MNITLTPTIIFFIAVIATAIILFYIYLIQTRISRKKHNEVLTQNQSLNSTLNEKNSCIACLEVRIKHIEDSSHKKDEDLGVVSKKYEEAHSALSKATQQIESLKEHHLEKIKEIETVQENFKNQIKIIGGEIIKEQTNIFKADSKEHIGTILNPFKENMDELKKKLDSTFHEYGKEQGLLKSELKTMCEINKTMNAQAQDLTNALKGGSKTRGNWGEITLERLLEEASLIEGTDYHKQGTGLSIKHEETGRIQKPDITISLPDKKHIIIDSKLSLIHYEQYYSEDPTVNREQALLSFLTSIKTHISDLSKKNYHESPQINSPDFVLMFLPIEGSLSLALEKDNTLFNFAWEKNIVLVCPSTLFATLKTVSYILRSEKQKMNSLEIAKMGGKLYDKLAGLLSDIQKLGSQFNTANKTYKEIISKLKEGKGNLLSRAEKLKSLGAQTNKKLPELSVTDLDVTTNNNPNEDDNHHE